eukprot:NODE_1796_length_1377_cov_80.897600_g1704_i0.p1 GENE.NODE_1796_length_1377_cov_80.897600_g1704_i0~~NODE_1796_length_1377_cov_80.897600_g1704_i0.p1  ORF type:complete len:408 (+),score=100.32 NODE_1796_length_1377_cov_80.897600_g1704_i0:55-1278(+)
MRALLFLFLAHACLALYSKNGPVTLLTSKTFQNEVTNGDQVWLIEFFAPWCGHCKSLVPEWEKAAKALKGIVKVAAVDATTDQSLAGQYSIQGFPTILVFGSSRTTPQPYNGGRTAEAIVEAALKAVREVATMRLTGKKSGGSSAPNSDVVELTASNFQKEVLDSSDGWLVEFFAPWCGHCKNLAPEWAKAATDLKGVAKLGAVDATVHGELAQRYGVNGYPTIKFFAPGAKGLPTDYDGGRTAAQIIAWSMSKMDEYGVGPEVNEVTTQEQMQEECLAKKICVVALVPHLIDGGASARQDLLAVVKDVAKAFRAHPIAFVWMQGGVQSEWEQALRLDFGYPAVVVLSSSKQRAAIHKGAFTLKSLSQTLTAVLQGGNTVSFKALPPLRKATPWDGKEYVPEEEEEY